MYRISRIKSRELKVNTLKGSCVDASIQLGREKKSEGRGRDVGGRGKKEGSPEGQQNEWKYATSECGR